MPVGAESPVQQPLNRPVNGKSIRSLQQFCIKMILRVTITDCLSAAYVASRAALHLARRPRAAVLVPNPHARLAGEAFRHRPVISKM